MFAFISLMGVSEAGAIGSELLVRIGSPRQHVEARLGENRR
jgi:hypothetical protein